MIKMAELKPDLGSHFMKDFDKYGDLQILTWMTLEETWDI